MSAYNYSAFSPDDYDFDTETGPGIGEKAPDLTLTTLDGTPHRLLDFPGDFLVLEMGSITCPLFQSRRPGMQGLSRDMPGVTHAVLYVREAHPGDLIPPHRSQSDKLACAAHLRDRDGEGRLILVDDLDGTAHRALGEMPNAVFILNRNGCVVFRSDWNNPAATRRALLALREGRPAEVKSWFRPARPATALRTLRQAGRGSASDFLRGLPFLIWTNMIKRNLRTALGRAPQAGADTTC